MHMQSKGKANHLIREKSPYLLQHAHNPVNWYPWGEDAFQKAKKEDKPIFLSIGYSTCHWCHVMEKESFENQAIADLLNENFVSIKVDREERPDIDQIYMQFVVGLLSSGGWPLNVFLTPDLKPFYGGTYFPPNSQASRYRHQSDFPTILNHIREIWKSKRNQVFKTANEYTQAMQAGLKRDESNRHPLDENILDQGYLESHDGFDSAHGGFGSAPKFPRTSIFSFLLRHFQRMKEPEARPEALQMVEETLTKMAKGGIDDHLGGGFHRYSTDQRWHVPHFEKMLYDQALISRTYLETYQVTQNQLYAAVARDIFDYVLRDMTNPEGAFYSAEDADSAADAKEPDHKSEGVFYIWSKEEIEKYLGKSDSEIFNFYFGVEPNGNVESDPHGEFTGKNILFIARSIDETAAQFGKTPNEIETSLNESKKKLFTARSKRPRPHLDDKTLTDWNGLMISSLAYGARVLREDRYLQAAEKAADFMITKMIQNGRLMHRYRDREVVITGFLDDYAFFAYGLLDLYEASFNPKYLEEAKKLVEKMIELFWDGDKGGFFFSGHDSEKLIAETKELYDGAVPSGNSVATLVLLKLSHFLMDSKLNENAQKVFDFFSSKIAAYPSAYPQMLIALDFALGPTREIVIAGDENQKETEGFVREINAHFSPNQVVLFHPMNGENRKKIETLSPFLKEQNALHGKTSVYVCKNYACSLPVTELSKLKNLLND